MAACVLGGVRLISSARRMFAKTGPLMKRNARVPLTLSSSIISVPVMSDGMRSGVNWMRLNSRSMAREIVRTMSVLARPGTPIMRQWPRANSAVSRSSTMCSWPMMTLAISSLSFLRAAPSFWMASRSLAEAPGALDPDMSGFRVPTADIGYGSKV